MVRSANEARAGTHHGSPREPEGAASARGDSGPDAARSPTTAEHPLDPLLKKIAAVRESALHYLEAQKDTTQAAIRRVIAKVIVGALAAVIGVSALVACTVLLLGGLADAIGIAAGGRPWVGDLAVGGGLLVLTAIGTAVYVWNWMRSSRAKTIHKYENKYESHYDAR